MRDVHHRVMPAVVLCVALLTAAVLALAPAPAHAYGAWAHTGTTGCVCHSAGTPTDASCTSCHTGFQSYPDDTCWSCHYPGQDTSTLSMPSAACGQECHLWNSAEKAYTTPATHGTNPHLGSTPDGCLNCHQTSVSIVDPGSSPHHSGQATGFADCQACHSAYQQHAGKVQCTTCHKTAVAFHLYTADSPGFKSCRSCHAMRHDRRRVAGKKCATCHKGRGPGAASVAQHATSVTKKLVCGACHKQRLHASALGSRIRGCGTCHKSRFHAAQRRPSNSACLGCHGRASRHTNGYSCTLCHRSQVHVVRPRVPKIRG